MGYIKFGTSDRAKRKRRKLDDARFVQEPARHMRRVELQWLPLEILEHIFFFSLNEAFPMVCKYFYAHLSKASLPRQMQYIRCMYYQVPAKEFVCLVLNRKFFNTTSLNHLENRLKMSLNAEDVSIPARLLQNPHLRENLQLIDKLIERGARASSASVARMPDKPQERIKMMELFIEHRAIKLDNDALRNAVLLDDLELCKLYIAQGLQPDKRIIKLAAQQGNRRLVEYFISTGAKFDLELVQILASHYISHGNWLG